MNLNGKNVLLGVASSVAIYKACSLIGRLRHIGCSVKVVMTKNATELITPRYFAELTGNPVAVEMFAPINAHTVEHISLAEWADVVIVAPATFNIINKVASGIADDMLSTTLAAIPIPSKTIVFAPAMNTGMWENPVLQGSITRLKNCCGHFHFVNPVEGRLACGTTGIGKMAEPAAIVKYVEENL